MKHNVDKIALMSAFRAGMVYYTDRMAAEKLNIEQAIEKLRGLVEPVLQAMDLTQQQVNERLSEYMSRIKNSKTMNDLYVSSNRCIESLVE